jgi:hypothetical protein
MSAQTGSELDRKSGGGELHSPEHQPSSGEFDAACVNDTKDFGAVRGEAAPVHGHAKPGDTGEASAAGHVAEASSDVKVMTAAGASADGGTLAVAAIGKDVTTSANDQALQGHSISVGDSQGKVKKKMKADVTKVTWGTISC